MASLTKILSVVVHGFQTVIGNSTSVEGTMRGAKSSTFELFQRPGSIGIPVENDQGVYVQVGENRIIIATQDYNFSILIDGGEHIVYARDADGAVKGYTHYKNDGSILTTDNDGNYKIEHKPDGTHVFNDGTVSAVKFDELKTAFDQLVSDFNAHTHTGNLSLPTSTPATASTASIDDSEVTDVKFP
jgi:hypothetical protein